MNQEGSPFWDTLPNLKRKGDLEHAQLFLSMTIVNPPTL